MRTTVVNLRTEKADVVIDRRSRWGNPYRIGSEFRDEAGRLLTVDRALAIALYRVWLSGRCAGDPTFLYPLRGKRLGCWCRPLACHGDVLVEFVERELAA